LNRAIDGVNLYPTYRKPFDLIVKKVKNHEWSALVDYFRTFQNLNDPGFDQVIGCWRVGCRSDSTVFTIKINNLQLQKAAERRETDPMVVSFVVSHFQNGC
jgi:hypothetical protein